MEVNSETEKGDLCSKEITLLFINDEVRFIQTFNYASYMLGMFLSVLGIDDQIVDEKGHEWEVSQNA